MLGMLHHGWAFVEPYIVSYGAAAIFVLIFLESLGAPLPGETSAIVGSLLAVKGELSITSVYAAVLFGAILGDSTGYAIGRFGGRAVLRKFGPYIKLTPDRLAQIEARFHKGGPWLVLIARFIPVVRQVNGLVAGSLSMPWHHFLIAQATGAVLWTSVYCLGPYFFSEFFHQLRH